MCHWTNAQWSCTYPRRREHCELNSSAGDPSVTRGQYWNPLPQANVLRSLQIPNFMERSCIAPPYDVCFYFPGPRSIFPLQLLLNLVHVLTRINLDDLPDLALISQ